MNNTDSLKKAYRTYFPRFFRPSEWQNSRLRQNSLLFRFRRWLDTLHPHPDRTSLPLLRTSSVPAQSVPYMSQHTVPCLLHDPVLHNPDLFLLFSAFSTEHENIRCFPEVHPSDNNQSGKRMPESSHRTDFQW